MLARVRGGARLTFDEGLTLFREATVLEAGEAADEVRRRKHPVDRVTYQVDRNINYTNVCIYRCAFCAFYRPGGRRGGLRPPLGRDRTEGRGDDRARAARVSSSRAAFTRSSRSRSTRRCSRSSETRTIPRSTATRFSAPEIYFLAKKEKTPIADVLAAAPEAGLQSIPGGGAEILEDSVRKRDLVAHEGAGRPSGSRSTARRTASACGRRPR